MERFLDQPCDPRQLSPLTLAFLGDAVYELFVRESLVCQANRPVKALHEHAVRQVKAAAQAEAMQRILPLLTREEADVARRGRNAHANHTPKNARESDYHSATGLEALFGYLYIKGELPRLRALFLLIQGEEEEAT